jgi:LAO/AO transport system kinase
VTDAVAKSILAGDVRAAARLMRDLDDRVPAAIPTLKALFPHTGKARVVGLTGNPGAGKSTVVDCLISLYRERGERVGVVCVDPTSPFTGGAILGDRIRMQKHSTDSDVFIRSLATRGQLGGLSRSTFDVICVLDAMKFDRILVETVGVGQDEVDVMQTVQTSVVITVPGLGDDIQAIKSGILEIADVLCVNKADREGADRAVRDLVHMLDLRASGDKKNVPIIQTIATRGLKEDSGIRNLAVAIEAHEATLSSPAGLGIAENRARAHIVELVRGMLADRAARAVAGHSGLAALAKDVAARKSDPYSAAESIVSAMDSRAK